MSLPPFMDLSLSALADAVSAKMSYASIAQVRFQSAADIMRVIDRVARAMARGREASVGYAG